MHAPSPVKQRPVWLPGAIVSSLGVVIGTVALVGFCYALGLNFREEGWPQGRTDLWQTNRSLLLACFAGFTISILLFWFGLNHAIRASNR